MTSCIFLNHSFARPFAADDIDNDQEVYRIWRWGVPEGVYDRMVELEKCQRLLKATTGAGMLELARKEHHNNANNIQHSASSVCSLRIQCLTVQPL
jgi:hypothetical protein